MDQMDRVIRKKKSDQGVHGESYSTIRPIIQLLVPTLSEGLVCFKN